MIVQPRLDLEGVGDPADESPAVDPELFERIESLVGRRYLLNPQREVRPPTFRSDQDIYDHTRAFIRYIRRSQPTFTPEDVAAALGITLSDDDGGWRIATGNDPAFLPFARVWKLDAAALATDDGYAIFHKPAGRRDDFLLVDLHNRFTATRHGETRLTRSGDRQVTALNAADATAMLRLAEDFANHVNSLSPGGRTVGRLEIGLDDVARLLADLGNPKTHSKDNRHRYVERVGERWLSGRAHQIAYAAVGGRPVPEMVAATHSPTETHNYLLSAAYRESDHYDPQRATAAHAADEILRSPAKFLAAAHKHIEYTTAPATTEGLRPFGMTTGWFSPGMTGDGKEVELARIDGGAWFRADMLDRLETNIKHVALLGTYREFLHEQVGQEVGRALQREYLIACTSDSAARVFEQKKHTPLTHLAAASSSVFATSGDFRHVEVDGSVDLAKLDAIGDEYARLRPLLPQTEPPSLRFRFCGRHQAAGVYHPHADNIAVDPRHPSSFLHEYFHHLDWTDKTGPTLPSSSPEFAQIVRQVSAGVRSDEAYADNPALLRHDTTPTEIFAHAAERYYSWKGVETSLNHGPDEHRPIYPHLDAIRDQVEGYFDDWLAEGGVDLGVLDVVGVHEPGGALGVMPKLDGLWENEIGSEVSTASLS